MRRSLTVSFICFWLFNLLVACSSSELSKTPTITPTPTGIADVLAKEVTFNLVECNPETLHIWGKRIDPMLSEIVNASIDISYNEVNGIPIAVSNGLIEAEVIRGYIELIEVPICLEEAQKKARDASIALYFAFQAWEGRDLSITSQNEEARRYLTLSFSSLEEAFALIEKFDLSLRSYSLFRLE